MTTLPALFAARRRERPDAVALAFPGWGEVSYEELLTAVERLAAGFVADGLAPGDRVALVASNRPETVMAGLAILRAGGVVVPVNVAYKAPEMRHLLEDSEPRWVVAEGALRGEVDGAVATMDGGPPVLDLGEVVRGGSMSAPNQLAFPAHEDPALLVYTSGTTGRGKGAILTHGNLTATIEGLREAWEWRADDRLLLTLPLFHVHGLVVGLFTALASGARVELRRRFRAESVAEELADGPTGPVSLFFGVPTMYVRLVEAIEALEDRGAIERMRLFASGSAPLAPETFAAFQRLTGHATLERYGMSETGMNLSNPYRGERRPGTVGVPLPGVAIRVVDRGGGDVPDGADGELAVDGPNVFRGYHRQPAQTAESFLPGEGGRRWFRTGDLARRDPESGYVTLLGRSRELVIRGGLNVYPREVEEVLETAPGVREAAVAGRRDRDLGEVPVAWVVAEDGVDPDPEAILAHCRERLAGFKVPEEVRFVEELPRNALGKVQKHRLS